MMKRIDIEALLRLAHETRSFIEVDREENIAVATIEGTEFWARIAPAVDGKSVV
jgi:hypothetical protein